MKNIKYLGFVGLGWASLLLTGCGENSSTLTCTREADGDSQKIVFTFNDEEDDVVSAKAYSTQVIPDGTTDEEIEEAKSLLEQGCDLGMFKDCKTSVNDDKIEFEGYLTSDGLDELNFYGSKEDVKTKIEESGYTCK